MSIELHQQALSLSKNYHLIESQLLDVLEKINDQKMYLTLGYDSLFTYCVSALQLSESKAYSFSALLKKSKAVPEIKQQVQSGALTLSKASRIVSILTPENKDQWIEKAKILPKQELEKAIAKENPQLIQRTSIQITNSSEARVHLTLSLKTLNNLKRLQEITSKKSRKVLNLMETLEAITEEALNRLDPLRKAKRVLQKKPEASKSTPANFAQGKIVTPVKLSSRTSIPSRIKHRAILRDHGRCQYRSRLTGIQCQNSRFTEFHHKRPISLGGNHALTNITTLCSSHHRQHHAESRLLI